MLAQKRESELIRTTLRGSLARKQESDLKYGHKFKKLRGVLRRLMPLVGRKFCHHRFDMNDLHRTGIPEPERPEKGSGYQAFSDWQNELFTGECHTKRVACPCWKCGKMFYAHCGLDITTRWTPKPPPNKRIST